MWHPRIRVPFSGSENKDDSTFRPPQLLPNEGFCRVGAICTYFNPNSSLGFRETRLEPPHDPFHLSRKHGGHSFHKLRLKQVASSVDISDFLSFRLGRWIQDSDLKLVAMKKQVCSTSPLEAIRLSKPWGTRLSSKMIYSLP